MTAARGAVLLLALTLTAVNLRSAVSSVGAVLPEIQSALQLPSALAGVLTSLPVLCFAAIGPAAPLLARRAGTVPALGLGLVAMTIGTATRPLTDSGAVFFAASTLAYAGCALVNVLLPGFIRRELPGCVPLATALYSSAIAVGVAAGSFATVPIIRSAGTEWRLGLGVWAAPMLAALVLGALVVPRRPFRAGVVTSATARSRRPVRAWSTAVYFGTQGLQSYVAIGWLPRFFREEGLDATLAGALVALLLIIAVPLSAVIPLIHSRTRRSTRLVIALSGAYLAGYLVLAVDPVAGAVVAVVLIGIGAGAFPLALTMIGSHSDGVEETARFSGFVQSAGYVVAAPGPVVVGLVAQAGFGGAGLLTVLLTACVVQLAAGIVMTRPRDASRMEGATGAGDTVQGREHGTPGAPATLE